MVSLPYLVARHEVIANGPAGPIVTVHLKYLPGEDGFRTNAADIAIYRLSMSEAEADYPLGTTILLKGQPHAHDNRPEQDRQDA